MCIQFAKGKCKDGELCRYAHNVDELRGDKSEKEEQTVETNYQAKQIIFEEDNIGNPYDKFKASKLPTSEAHKLRKVVHSSDYEDEQEEDQSSGQYDPTQHRYNYFNPFFFYSFNNFPVYYPITVNQTMPFFNYISINNHNNDKNDFKTDPNKNSDESSQFNSKSSDEGKNRINNPGKVSNSYEHMPHQGANGFFDSQ